MVDSGGEPCDSNFNWKFTYIMNILFQLKVISPFLLNIENLGLLSDFGNITAICVQTTVFLVLLPLPLGKAGHLLYTAVNVGRHLHGTLLCNKL